MKEKLIRFMQGRYGVDQFSRFLLITSVVVMVVISLFSYSPAGQTLYLICLFLLAYSYFRILSRNIGKRYAENQNFLAKTYKIRCFMQKKKGQLTSRKTHHIYKCPNCKQKIRVPRGKGKIEIRCPKCGTTFVKRS